MRIKILEALIESKFKIQFNATRACAAHFAYFFNIQIDIEEDKQMQKFLKFNNDEDNS